jgi:transposase
MMPSSVPEGLLMLGPPKVCCLDEPVTASLDALVAPDNFYRRLAAALDLSFVRDWVADCYATRGRPSIDPVVFFKLQLIMFFEDIRSERQLMETVRYHVAHRWYLRYQLDEPLPDHSSLTRIRERLGLPLFERFFDRVVELCQQAGLVWGKELFFDGTKVQADAAIGSLRSRWSVQAHAYLEDIFAGDATGTPPWELPETDDEAAPDDVAEAPPNVQPVTAIAAADAPRRLPFAGMPAEERQLAAANQARWQLLEEHRRNPDQPSGSRGYRCTSDDKMSTTDPDATPMRRFNGDVPKLGYHNQYVVDGGTARIILAALVTPADVMDNTPMLDLFHRVCFRWQLRPERVVGDAKFGTIPNIRQLEDAGVRAFTPMPELGRRFGFYGPEEFRYDAEQDEYICPQGQRLTFERIKYTEDVAVYRGDPGVCWDCPVRKNCTDSFDGRIIHRSVFSEYIERVKGYYGTEAYQTAMRKRGVWVEPLFGEAKDWHGLRRFRLRGLWKVNCEALRIAAGQNLKRLLSKARWGHRPGPVDSMSDAVQPSSLMLVVMLLSLRRSCPVKHFSTA